MAFYAEILITVLLVAGGVFGIVGSYGLIKLPHPMMRLHAPTKATTLGVGSILIASMTYFLAFGSAPSVHELMITLFLFLTAPITAHFIAKAFIHRHVDADELARPAHGAEWAVHGPDEGTPQPPREGEGRG